MTTRQQKRAKRSHLIHQLQRLEIQHQLVNGPDFIISQCEGCEICTKIRAIGEELSPSNVLITNPNRQEKTKQKYPYTTLIGRMTVDEYWKFKEDFVSDKEICKLKEVSIKAMSNWKRFNKIRYQMPTNMRGMVR